MLLPLAGGGEFIAIRSQDSYAHTDVDLSSPDRLESPPIHVRQRASDAEQKARLTAQLHHSLGHSPGAIAEFRDCLRNFSCRLPDANYAY
jgi:hypothetical protein